MFWAKQQLSMLFIQNLSLIFFYFSDLNLNESGSSGDSNRWYPLSRKSAAFILFVYIKSTHKFK